ncbi:hypothetical protein [Singulisphaera sp. PoT]|uniref:hypothetical protein n=1 Tax=Singulisphaera sp. PoT TaxID=3411797 RepID=UPI003BF4705E
MALAVSGCGEPATPTSLVPESAVARQALERALEFWKEGRPTGRVEPTTPRLQVVDAHRKPGQALASYQIVAEAVTPRERTFSVKVVLDNPQEEALVRFLVMGADPILIFRQEDFDLMMHWEHKMEPRAEDGPDAPVAPGP